MYLPLHAVVLFAWAWAFAMAFRRTTAVHARFMIATALVLLDPVGGRLLYYYGPPFANPVHVQIVTFGLADLVLLALLFRPRMAPQPRRVYLAGAALFPLVHLGVVQAGAGPGVAAHSGVVPRAASDVRPATRGDVGWRRDAQRPSARGPRRGAAAGRAGPVAAVSRGAPGRLRGGPSRHEGRRPVSLARDSRLAGDPGLAEGREPGHGRRSRAPSGTRSDSAAAVRSLELHPHGGPLARGGTLLLSSRTPASRANRFSTLRTRGTRNRAASWTRMRSRPTVRSRCGISPCRRTAAGFPTRRLPGERTSGRHAFASSRPGVCFPTRWKARWESAGPSTGKASSTPSGHRRRRVRTRALHGSRNGSSTTPSASRPQRDRLIHEWKDGYGWLYCMMSDDGRRAIAVASRGPKRLPLHDRSQGCPFTGRRRAAGASSRRTRGGPHADGDRGERALCRHESRRAAAARDRARSGRRRGGAAAPGRPRVGRRDRGRYSCGRPPRRALPRGRAEPAPPLPPRRASRGRDRASRHRVHRVGAERPALGVRALVFLQIVSGAGDGVPVRPCERRERCVPGPASSLRPSPLRDATALLRVEGRDARADVPDREEGTAPRRERAPHF